MIKKVIHLLIFLASSPVLALQNDSVAPNFSVSGIDKQSQISLADYKNKVLYVDFWASWCPPCRKGMPQLNDLRNAYKEKGFEIIAINLDEDISDAINFLNDVKVDYPVAYDPSGQISEKYEVIGLPQAFLIGRDGEIKHIHQGFRKGDIDKLRAIVDKLTN